MVIALCYRETKQLLKMCLQNKKMAQRFKTAEAYIDGLVDEVKKEYQSAVNLTRYQKSRIKKQIQEYERI